MRFDSGRVLVCAALFAAGLPSTVSAFDKTWSNNSDWSQGAENHVNHTDVPDQIQLNKDTQEEIFTPFIWIANSGSNTVAKMDTRNGSHYPGSPYPVCSNPSRTAVDMEGNCWVGCRNDGRVMKLDKDTGRVLVDVKPGGNVIRAVAIDAEGYVWVGAWDMHRMYKLNPNTGQTMKIVDNVTCPYGAAADRVGRIWAVGSWCSEAGSGRLTLISSSGTIIRTWNSSIGNLYGIGIDSHNHAWVGAWQSRAVVEFDPNSPNPVRTISLAGVGRGVAIDGFDNVWVAMSDNKSDTNQVAKLNRAAGFSVSYVNVGTGPVGVAVDQDNNVWVVNMGSATVTKIRASDSQVIGTYATKGTGPYTYSDMTGFQLQSIAKPAVGTWTVQFNAGCPAWWRSINWKASTPAGTSVKLRARTAGSRPGLATASWSGPYTVPGSTLSVPDNAWIEIQVELSSNDASSVVPSVQELTITYNGRPEQCDGLDNDCNGVPDDGLTRSCRTACGTGTETCVNGTWQNCDAPPVLPEVCDYRDNDCDGDIDEGVQNACGECGEVPEETCNGIDDDCDGTIDEGCQCIAGQTRACGTDEGECSSGIQECKELPDGSTYWDTECIGEVPPAEEVCDGLDNDCDGRVDEGCDCVTGETRPCGSDVGACRPGIQICDDQGRWGECVGYIEPAQEVCDCFDNDCDGEVDEGDLCPGGSVCAECKCADPCVFGECPAGKQCINGYCVPIDCSQVQCDQGYVCKWGLCVPSCEGVECPDGKTCLDGTCVYDDCRSLGCPAGQRCVAKKCEKDPCYGVECNEGEFCRDGGCVKSCGRVFCDAGSVCIDGECVPDPCSLKNCPAGTKCRNGDCIPTDVECGEDEIPMPDGSCATDPCAFIDCPQGQVCDQGQCIAGDTDGDGVPDYEDPDIDGDGIPNDQDKGPAGEDFAWDHDNDYQDDVEDLDDDNDGIPDTEDKGPGGEDLSRDHDNDGIDDAKDPDDDNDGINDEDDDCGGLMDCSADHDNDGVQDSVDKDDDNDGIEDSKDVGKDGQDMSHDSDNDGRDDAEDLDDDNDGIPDTEDKCGPEQADCSHDTDNDGVPNLEDEDDDNDGHPDSEDAFPLDPNRWSADDSGSSNAPAPTTCGCGSTGSRGIASLLALLALSLLGAARKRS